ncbi:MAG: metallophosphoesterase [Pseudomonadota bacterium]
MREIALLTSVGAFALSAVAASLPASAQDSPLVRFGVIADPQYAPAPPRGSRYYANSLWKLSEAVDAFNQEDLAFVVTLGDIIDRHVDAYTHILPIYERVETDNLFVLGNHEYDVASDYVTTVPSFLGMDERYYDFAVNGVRFIVIDGNDLSLFANPEGTPRHEASVAMYDAMVAADQVNAQTWNGGLSDEQLAWLEDRLDAAQAAGEQVVVLGHYPLAPEDIHNLWNYEDVVALLGGYDNVMAYLNGHNHGGHYGVADGVHYVTVEGMVETAAETAYAIVEVHTDQVVIDGFGRVTDRELAHPAQ